MKSIIRLLLITIFCQYGNIYSQCKAKLDISIPQCKMFVANLSDPSYVVTWNINGTIYTNNKNGFDFQLDDYEIFNICLYVTDTANHCSDTACQVVQGRKKVKFDTYVYKQNLILTVLTKPSKSTLYIVSWRDGFFTSSPPLGLFQHAYAKPGKYPVAITIYDSIPNTRKYCSFLSGGDSITIDHNSQCRPFFIWYDEGRQDSTWLINRSVGEHLKYTWYFGDGSSSNQKYPVHTYSTTGKKQVCLAITDSVTNCSGIYCDSLQTYAGLHLQIIGGITYEPPQSIGIINPDLLGQVSLYPNPFNNHITLTNLPAGEPVTWQIKTPDGRHIREGFIAAAGAEETIQTEGLAEGMYFLTLRSGNSQNVIKLIKLD